jgi:hypothetical protein
MSKPKLPPVNQVKIFCSSHMDDLARELASLLGMPGVSVQTMLQSESSAYSSIEQRVICSVTVTVVYRQYEVPATCDVSDEVVRMVARVDGETPDDEMQRGLAGADTAVLPREEAVKVEGKPEGVEGYPTGVETVVAGSPAEADGVPAAFNNESEHG